MFQEKKFHKSSNIWVCHIIEKIPLESFIALDTIYIKEI